MGKTIENAQQMFWLPERGITVTLPPLITQQISGPIARREDVDPLQFHRLSIIANDPIMRKRLPSSKDGLEYMTKVDLSWRQELLKEACSMTDAIRTSVPEVTTACDGDFAVIIFGSISRGLTRNRENEDPSNIDLSIIGNFSEDDRIAIFNRIRPTRDQIAARIGNNVGVFVQTHDKLIKNGYGAMIQYIGACAYALYDPNHIWSKLEEEALAFSKTKTVSAISNSQSMYQPQRAKKSRLTLVEAV